MVRVLRAPHGVNFPHEILAAAEPQDLPRLQIFKVLDRQKSRRSFLAIEFIIASTSNAPRFSSNAPRFSLTMGLAGPKKRTKISNDPNNTQWSKSTTSFGHKILASQGWKPGEYLGAKDANHAEHYTKANASHIRVLLKDDNLGLGAKVGNQNAETFGLSQFSGLLGRLNGKSDEALKKEEDDRRDVELRLYHARKSGTMNFVSAGYLVGDKIEARQDWGGVDPGKKASTAEKEVEKTKEGVKAAKKRKRDTDATADSHTTKEKKKKSKRSKDTEPSTSTPVTDNDMDMADAKPRTKETKEERRARKAAKAAARLEKQKRKTEKRAAKASKPAAVKQVEADSSSSSEEEEVVETISRPASVPTSATSTPLGANPRRMIRSRYIASKRMASMDPNALKEIFMIKGSA